MMPGQTARSAVLEGNESEPHYVYRCFDRDGRLLYVGCTMDVQKRLYAHARVQARQNASWWLALSMDYHEVEGPIRGRNKARAAERKAIFREQPLFNIQDRGWSSDTIRNDVAAYLIAHGHRRVAMETACTCWPDDIAARRFSEWCVAHEGIAWGDAA